MLNTTEILLLLEKDYKKICKKIEEYEQTIENLYKQKNNLQDQISEWTEYQQKLIKGPTKGGT